MMFILPKNITKFIFLNIFYISNFLAIGACTPVIIGSAAVTAAIVVSDRRTAGTQLEDKNIELKIGKRVMKKLNHNTNRIIANSYNRRLLLTGDVDSEQSKKIATTLAQSVENVISVNNQMKIRPIASIAQRSSETWIESKIKSILSAKMQYRIINAVIDRDTVYLMGLVTHEEGKKAALIVSNINGVNQVVKFFEYISQEEANRLGLSNFSKVKSHKIH
ncbi:MAG: BON domain-containing protein [Bordetella sp.]|nr:MAG: BON domain-containing protein [Bordetella sp.]